MYSKQSEFIKWLFLVNKPGPLPQ